MYKIYLQRLKIKKGKIITKTKYIEFKKIYILLTNLKIISNK